ncbi:glutathione S-transferase family protein [Bradyrhizobium iriomotense]|uniref:glutathione S-transferase family protein n=1 Tax=Bradyrhizobium iriomotense TaxID=441950 RepID=UPI001B8A472D|nr:glutathione S-transferase family protein [Bradyrhizobium iriomotense]MBR1130831.1 glutathione S-transferase family protein [Bradyrhizobium iriomotense]
MTSGLILWGVGTGRTIRAHWALRELELEYVCKPILARSGETKVPEYTSLNPRQKIPLLQDGSFTIGESAAITAYLARKYRSGFLAPLPEDEVQYAKWLEWCFFIVSELDATSLYVMRRHSTGRGLAHIYGEAPLVVARAREYFNAQLKFAQVVLSDERKYLLGTQFTTADILLTTCLVWAIEYGLGLPEICLQYLERTTGRPAYRAAREANCQPPLGFGFRPEEDPSNDQARSLHNTR